MAEHGFRFGDHEYEIHVRAQPYVTGGTAYTASVYRIDGRDLQTMSEDEMTAAVDFVAADPEAGDVMQGTGGVRKARLAGRGKGKSGGYRIVWYFGGGTFRCSC